MLIDMEFSGINYPAFDIGCFFCEFAGVYVRTCIYMYMYMYMFILCAYYIHVCQSI